MPARTFRVTGIAYAGFIPYDLNFTFSTNETDQELVWARARREAKMHIGPGASIAIKTLKEVS